MAPSPLQHFTLCLLLAVFLTILTSESAQAHLDKATGGGLKLMADSLEWPITMSMYNVDDQQEEEEDADFEDGFVSLEEEEEGELSGRRSLFWRRFHFYYISYGALAAGRIPCPPRSGRSYYTHNCYRTRVPVNPYTRGCSRITRCRR